MACSRTHQTPIEQLLSQPDSPACVEFLSHCSHCTECAAELAAQRSRAQRSGLGGLVLGLCAGAVALISVFVWTSSRQSAPPAEPAPTIAEPQPEPSTAVSLPIPKARDREPIAELVSGETRAISLTTHPPGKPVRLSLRLVEPSADDDPRRVRVVSAAGELLEIEAEVSNDRMAASVEVPHSFLSPGRFMIEVHTTEKSHFPARRYAIDIQ